MGKLASGSQLKVLGGPLGAIVGGYSDSDWLYEEVFWKKPEKALEDAFALLRLKGREDGDWSNLTTEEVSLAYRRHCLKGHPSRGGMPREFLKLKLAMEFIRAFAGEAQAMPKRQGYQIQTLTPPVGQTLIPPVGFVLDDATLARELELSPEAVEREAKQMSRERLEEMNRAFDEYIQRQSRFKTEIVQEIAFLHENCAYAILGVSADATDEEIRRAYRLIAVLCHPDKGGDKEDFQELIRAYESIMEHRRAKNKSKRKPFDDGNDSDFDIFNYEKPKKESPKKKKNVNIEKEEENGDNDDSAEDEVEDLKERAERIAAGKKGGAEVNNETEDLRTPQETEEHADVNEGETGESFVNLIRAADKAAEEASLYAKTGAEFSRQAVEAAETARRGREKGTRDVMTRSVAHSAIVLTLTVVKAVRIVGYATFDVSMQCRMAARRNQEALGCVESAAKTMHLGLQALNAALNCSKVVEALTTELQTPTEEGDQKNATASADRFVNAAVEVSVAAQTASNAAMSAAIAAVYGSRACMKAMEKELPSNSDEAQQDATDPDLDENKAIEDEEASTELACKEPQPGDEEYVPKPSHRQIMQRKYNHKTFNQLNEDLLLHQKDVREFLQENRQLIPQISSDTKRKIFGILRDYAKEARAEIETQLREISFSCPGDLDLLLSVIQEMPLLTPFLQPADVAIPSSVKARVLKMAALCDMPEAMKLINSSVFDPVLCTVPQESEAWTTIGQMQSKVRAELDFEASVVAPIVATDGAPADEM